MRSVILLTLFLSYEALAASGVKGTVSSPKDCGKEVMVWLSLDKDNYQERLLLMHTEVPVGGSFQFYLKPGDYQVRASDQKGCEFFKRVKVQNSVVIVPVKLEKK